MAQYQITVNQELLHYLFLSNNKDSGVAALLESVLNQILQAQATETTISCTLRAHQRKERVP